MNVLVLESSTTSAKAMLYSPEGKSAAVLDKAYEPKYADTTIHDAASVFMQTAALGRQISEGKDIDIIVLSGTWHSVMLCDERLTPVTPVYTWAYTGARDLCRKLRQDGEYTKNFYTKTGCMVNAIYPVFKLILLKEQGCDLKNHLILGQGTYNYFRLTGKCVVMDSMASGSGLLNIHTKKYDADILKEAGITEEQLPRIVTYRETSPLSREGAELLGLRQGIPVVPAGPDGGLNQVGAGALKEGIMTFSVGTSGALRLSSGKPVVSDNNSTWCYLSPFSWLSGVAVSGCCNCVDYIKSRLFPDGKDYHEIEKKLTEDKINPPVFLPFLFGERCPGWDDERTAAIHGLKPEHTAYDIYRSVLEGTLFNLYQSYLELVKLHGVPKKIKLSGGILNSPLWTQMCADIFRTELETDETKHSSMMGGAVLGVSILKPTVKAEEYKVPAGKIIMPDAVKGVMYQERFEKYLKYYHMG